jgi:uncharacterized protein (DUF58 family)
MFRGRLTALSPAFPWITLRFFWALVAIAALVAAGTFVHVALQFAIFAATFVAGLLATDLALGPPRRALEVTREPVQHLALRSRAFLRYAVTNKSGTSLTYEIVDTPIEMLDVPETPVRGIVGPLRRKIAELPVMPRLRGPARLGTVYVTVQNPIGFIARRWRLAGDTEIRVYPDLSAVERYGELARRGRLI